MRHWAVVSRPWRIAGYVGLALALAVGALVAAGAAFEPRTRAQVASRIGHLVDEGTSPWQRSGQCGIGQAHRKLPLRCPCDRLIGVREKLDQRSRRLGRRDGADPGYGI